METRRFLVLILFFIVLGCYHNEKTDQFVTIRKTDSKFYELDLKTLNSGRGNLHNMDLSKFEYTENLWLYLTNLKGKIEGDSIIWTKERGELYYPWRKEKVKGYVLFDSNMVEINLLSPYYKDGKAIDHWEPYEKNGHYRVKLELDSITNVIFTNPYE